MCVYVCVCVCAVEHTYGEPMKESERQIPRLFEAALKGVRVCGCMRVCVFVCVFVCTGVCLWVCGSVCG